MRPKAGKMLSVAGLLTFATSASAHTDGNWQNWMMDGSWMHSGSHMLGYNMWGMEWYGLFFGLALWALVILGIIYLYQQVTGKEVRRR